MSDLAKNIVKDIPTANDGEKQIPKKPINDEYNETVMINLMELCICGELFFFVNDFSDAEFEQVEVTLRKIFLDANSEKKELSMLSITQKLQKETGLALKQCKINRVIAISEPHGYK